MPMIHGSFRTHDVASHAFAALADAGISFANPSLLSRQRPGAVATIENGAAGAGSAPDAVVTTLARAGVDHDEAVAAEDALACGRVVAILEVAEGDVQSVREVFSTLDEDTDEKPGAGREPNEGEGNRTAARRYDEGVEKTIASGRVDELAREAQRAVDDPVQGPVLKRAEAEGKRDRR